MPNRIQRRRTKGWRLPAGAICVSRPSKFGNTFTSGTPAQNVANYRRSVERSPRMQKMIRDELRGKDLACWCPLDQPCHADVQLDFANR